MKIFLALMFALAVFCGGMVTSVEAGQANIFIYHRFGESRYPSTSISLEDFRSHLEILRQEEVEVLRLGEVVERLRNGRPLPEHIAVLTIDDGFRSFLTGAMPLLREYGFPATLFISTDSVGGEQYLSWKEIAALKEEGVEIGNHTASHPHMVDPAPEEGHDAWLKRLQADLLRAKDAFRSHLDAWPRLFAYPYGEYSPEVQALIRREGFQAAVAQQSGVVVDTSDLFALPRFPMAGGYAAPVRFREKLRMHHLPVSPMSTINPLLGKKNPPVLVFRVPLDRIDPRRIKCFVPGQEAVGVQPVEGEDEVYRAVARRRLEGRRSKYTLTAPLKTGGWGWTSFLWIRPEIPEGGY